MPKQQLIATVLEGMIRMVPYRIWLSDSGVLWCSCARIELHQFSERVTGPGVAVCRHITWLYDPPALKDRSHVHITLTPLGREEFDWRLAARKLIESAR